MFLFLRVETSGRAADCLRSVGHLFYIILLISFFTKSQCFGFVFLQAWNKFVTISFPDEQFTQTWRNTLLEDLKTRIQQVGDSPGRPGWGARAAGVPVLCLEQELLETWWLWP